MGPGPSTRCRPAGLARPSQTIPSVDDLCAGDRVSSARNVSVALRAVVVLANRRARPGFRVPGSKESSTNHIGDVRVSET